MTAPALILVASGTGEHDAAQALHGLRRQLQMARPDLDVSLAFLNTCPPSGPQVLSVLATRGVTEVVFVPVDLTRAIDVSAATASLIDNARVAYPQLTFALARPIGPAIELLNVLDDTLREALRASHVSEIDGLVLSAPWAGDIRGASLIARRARQWSAHHHIPVTVATADGHGLSVAQAIQALRGEGRRSIAVGSLWLVPDESYLLQRQQALQSGAVAVSYPCAQHANICDLVVARYAFAAMELLTDEMLGLVEIEDTEELGQASGN